MGAPSQTNPTGLPERAKIEPLNRNFPHFPTKSGLAGRAKQCIVRKNGFASCKTAANALFYNHSLSL